MKWMVGTPLPASGLRPDQRVICTEEVNSTVVAIVETQYAAKIAATPDLYDACCIMRRAHVVLRGAHCDCPLCEACRKAERAE